MAPSRLRSLGQVVDIRYEVHRFHLRTWCETRKVSPSLFASNKLDEPASPRRPCPTRSPPPKTRLCRQSWLHGTDFIKDVNSCLCSLPSPLWDRSPHYYQGSQTLVRGGETGCSLWPSLTEYSKSIPPPFSSPIIAPSGGVSSFVAPLAYTPVLVWNSGKPGIAQERSGSKSLVKPQGEQGE